MKLKKIPMRMCVGCKELKPKKELLRIVALPTGIIELDRTGKKSGHIQRRMQHLQDISCSSR